MTSPTHVVIGLTGSVILARLFSIPIEALSLLAILLGSIAPDIDGDGAITRPSRIFSLFVPRGLGRVLDGVLTSLSKFIQTITAHRGVFHWPVVGIGIAFLGYHFQNAWWFWFGWCYLLHVLADACTVAGVPLLGPISGRMYSLKICRTGSPIEAVIAAVFIAILIFSGFRMLPIRTQAAFEKLLSRIGVNISVEQN